MRRDRSQGGFAPTFVELTENRLPSTLVAGVHDVECVTFSPSYHLGSYVSYTIYAPDLVVYFSAPLYLERTGGMDVAGGATVGGGARSAATVRA